MSRLFPRRCPGPKGFPRVSGDEPFKSTLNFAGLEFSPRERG